MANQAKRNGTALEKRAVRDATAAGIAARKQPLSEEARFWSRVDKSGECWMWTGSVNKNGYGRFFVHSSYEMAHRYSYRLVHGDFDASLELCHACDNPGCVRPEHLFLGTHTENMQDCVAKDRKSWGAARTGAKLSETDVRAIRDFAAMGAMYVTLAAMFGVSRETVRNIVLRRKWVHLP